MNTGAKALQQLALKIPLSVNICIYFINWAQFHRAALALNFA